MERRRRREEKEKRRRTAEVWKQSADSERSKHDIQICGSAIQNLPEHPAPSTRLTTCWPAQRDSAPLAPGGALRVRQVEAQLLRLGRVAVP